MADKKSKKYTLTSAKSGAPAKPSGVSAAAQDFFNVVAGSPTFKPQTIKYGGKTYTSTPQYQEAGVGGLKTVAVKVGQTVLRDVLGVGKAAPKAVKPISTAKDLGAKTRNLPTTRFGPRKPSPTQLQKAAAARSTWSPKTAPNVVVGRRATGVTGRVLNSPGAQYVRANRAAGVPAGRTVAQMARTTVTGAGKTPKLQTSPGKGVGTPKKPLSKTQKAVGVGIAGAAGLYAIGRVTGPTSSSSADSRFTHQAQYRPMTAKPPYKNPMPQWALDGAGRRDNSYKGTYVGSTISKPKPKTPSGTPSSTNGGGGRPRQAGPPKKQVQARRAAITELLKNAEEAAAAGNIQAAANFSAAALNRQRAGKGSAASMKRVTKVARAYSTAAGRKKIENQMAGRTRLGKPPVKGKKG